MISYEIYKLLHFTGLVLLFSGLVTLLTMKISGVALEGPSRKFAFITHGLGLFLLILSGFGLLARLGLARESLPNWIYVKLVIWFFFGLTTALIKRKGHLGWKIYFPLIAVFMIAAYVAINKPF